MFEGPEVTGALQKTLAKFGKFLREVRAELSKVIWPDRRQTMVYTGIVVASVALIASIIAVADAVVSQIIAFILR